MQFKAGDVVVHPVYGVGHITAIEEKQFSELEACLYYQIALPKSNIWVPIEAQAAIGLRLVTAKGDLDKYRDLIKSRPVLLNSSLPKRHVELASRLKEGSFQTMCEVVRDLTASGWQKPLGATAKATLRKAQERLYQEWAAAAEISIAEATKEIDTLLQATQEAALK
jgi:RNA polymerase-interacting CarD/CdnL/TRCF family regulator